MTRKLYYEDAYRTEFAAKVLQTGETEKGFWVILDQTAFYPEGGGQGADIGILAVEPVTTIADNAITVRVLDVQEEDGQIRHYLSEPLAAGTCLTGQIDWDRRFDLMQQHSGEHIVSGMLCSRFHCDNVGFHLGADLVTIDYNASFSWEDVMEVEAAANRYIQQDHASVVMYPGQEELAGIDFRSKKELSREVRLISFPGADLCACCGVHVKNSAQAGPVVFLSAKKFHEGTRLELLCGKRAVDFLTMNYRVNKQAAMLMSTNEENTAERVEKLLAENAGLKGDLSVLEARLFELRAASFRGVQNVLVLEEELSGNQGRKLADRVADEISGTAVVFAKAANGYSYSVVSRRQDVQELVSLINGNLNGRGGGRGGFAQGSVQAGAKEIRQFFNEYKEKFTTSAAG